MYSRQKSKSDRRRKGRVQVKNSNDRLQLVFSHPIILLSGEIETKRFYLSTGQADTPLGRQQAAVLAATIQRDIDYGELDVTLKKYQSASPFPDDRFGVQAEIQLALNDLWERYEQFKTPQVGQTTIAKTYRRIRNHIARLPSQRLGDAVKIRDYLLAKVTPDTAKRVLTYINACCEWGVRSKLIDSNPFQGMASEIKVPKSVSEEMDINPFTREERDQVILAFEESKLYYYYAPLVKFLFFTGCRPSEAIAFL